MSATLVLTAATARAETFEIGFETKPAYLDKKQLALTFDDGPDDISTEKVLNTLKDKGVRATFFINTVNWADVDKSAAMQALVKRIVTDGHELANHTVHHLHLGQQTAGKIEEEIVGVERTVAKILGPMGAPLTMLRAPYGEPYTGAGGDLAKVSDVVSKHAVHIGWNIDSNDWACPTGNADCVMSNMKKLLGGGGYGVVLMHCVQPQTATALPGLIDYIRAQGFTFMTVEEVLKAKYGKTSAELMGMPATGGAGGVDAGAPGTGGTAGTGGGAGMAGAGGGGGSAAASDASSPGDDGAVATDARGSDDAGASTDSALASDDAATTSGTGGAGGSGGSAGSGGSSGKGGSSGSGGSHGSTTTPPMTTSGGSSGGCSFTATPASAAGTMLGLGALALILGLRRRRRR